MNCDDFQRLLADELGDELSDVDRRAFDRHLADCPSCRRDHETARRTLNDLRSLPAPEVVQLKRRGERFVLDESASGGRQRHSWMGPTWLRYAASVLLAFTAGYAFHAALVVGKPVPTGRPDANEYRVARNVRPKQGRFDEALVSAYTHDPRRSDLAKCMIAMFPAAP